MKTAAVVILSLIPSATYRGRPPAVHAPALPARSSETVLLELEDLNGGRDVEQPFRMARIPRRVWAQNGRIVRIRGYAFPTFESQVSRFRLLPETNVCPPFHTFRADPPVSYKVSVRLKSGRRLHFEEWRALEVVGRLRIRPLRMEGFWFRLYEIVDAEVKRVEPRRGYYPCLNLGC